MSRTLKQIYAEAISERNRRLELSEHSNDSKMSVMNGIAWMVAAMIYTFESILDGVQRDRLMRDVLRFLFSDK